MKYKTLVLTVFAVVSGHGQEAETPADPYRANPKERSESSARPAQDAGVPKNISICYETFSMPLSMAAGIRREELADSEVYERILSALDQEAVRQESFTLLRGRSGEKSTSESVSEQIYPTEFEPPELPNTVGVAIVSPKQDDVPTPVPETEKLLKAPDPEALEGIRTPATPTAFETRNVGVTMEVESVLGDDGSLLDVRLAAEHVALVDQTTFGQGLSTVEMPVFETQRARTGVLLELNRPFLLGTVNRPPTSSLDADSANRVWFAFVTGSLAKP